MVLHDSKGHLILIMAPMASGKGVLMSHVVGHFPEVKRLVSCTTREKRPGETEGKDYFFISRAEFERRTQAGEFMEWAEFSSNLYGTLKSELLAHMEEGNVVINEIDLHGVRNLLTLIPRECCTVIYIDAGDWETLKARALARAPMSEKELLLRHVHYLEETAYKHNADFIVQNNDTQLESAKEEMSTIVRNIVSRT